jgi:transcriptional/translational regulatory protein YebC/TACO1
MNVVIKIGAVSDNRNRTISEIKKILGDYDFKMVQPGSMTWIFNQPPINIDDPDLHKKIDKLFDALDEQDDIEDVTSNIQ